MLPSSRPFCPPGLSPPQDSTHLLLSVQYPDSPTLGPSHCHQTSPLRDSTATLNQSLIRTTPHGQRIPSVPLVPPCLSLLPMGLLWLCLLSNWWWVLGLPLARSCPWQHPPPGPPSLGHRLLNARPTMPAAHCVPAAHTGPVHPNPTPPDPPPGRPLRQWSPAMESWARSWDITLACSFLLTLHI